MQNYFCSKKNLNQETAPESPFPLDSLLSFFFFSLLLAPGRFFGFLFQCRKSRVNLFVEMKNADSTVLRKKITILRGARDFFSAQFIWLHDFFVCQVFKRISATSCVEVEMVLFSSACPIIILF